MTDTKSPDVLPVEGASIAEALETLSVVLDAHSANLYRLLPSPAGRERVAMVSEHNQAALATIRSALERAAAEGEALRAEARRAKSESAERAAMCLSNMGHDVTCGACMSQAFTGCGDFVHTCPAPPKGSTP